MKYIEKLYQWYGKRNVRVVFAVIAVLLLVVIFSSNEEVETAEGPKLHPVVSVGTPLELAGSESTQLIGTVRSVSEATIDSETSGRVTAVYGTLGAQVGAGQIIAQLDNAAEYASLLQAEGAYEAALVAAEASTISTSEAQNALNSAKNSAISAYTSTYGTLNQSLYSSLDEIIADPQNTYRSGGARLADYNQKAGLVDTLYDELDASLSIQNTKVVTGETIDTELANALTDTNTLIRMVQVLRTIIIDNDSNDTQSATETAYLATLSGLEQTLVGTRSSLEGAQTTLIAAGETLERAQLGDQTTELSSANAQLKQALGTLRAAQANYENTLLRSPISGVLQSLNVQSGDFIPSFSTVAKVVGEGGLEITTYVGDRDRDALSVGQIVTLEGNIEGIITNIAPAVDSVTKKTEVRIGTDSGDIKNGETVRISFVKETTSDEVIVPLAAVKLTADDASVFIVEEGVLVALPVLLGDVRGSSVVIAEGLSNSELIVKDVRGFAAGQQVEVK